MNARTHFTARLRRAARRRLSRFTNSGAARSATGLTEPRGPSFATGPNASVRLPVEPRFLPGPRGLSEHALWCPPH